MAKLFKIDLADKNIIGDHLGVQVLDNTELIEVSNQLLSYTHLNKEKIIHNRKNRIFKLNESFEVLGITLNNIEVFEPKPDADLKKLKPGIEHVAFSVKNYDSFLLSCQKNNVPIDKIVDAKGHKFFKTSFVNLVEIEFGNESLLDLR